MRSISPRAFNFLPRIVGVIWALVGLVSIASAFKLREHWALYLAAGCFFLGAGIGLIIARVKPN